MAPHLALKLVPIFEAYFTDDEVREYYQENVYAKLEAFAAERKIRSLNLFPGFRGEDPFSLHVSIVDEHPNARAHRIAADQLLPHLRRAVTRRRLAEQ